MISTYLSQPVDLLDVRAKHEALLCQRPRKTVTIEDFRTSTRSGGMKWTVINGSVYDLAFLIGSGSHPGGNFLHEYVGIDSTLYFYTSHIKSTKVWTRLRALDRIPH